MTAFAGWKRHYQAALETEDPKQVYLKGVNISEDRRPGWQRGLKGKLTTWLPGLR